MRRYLCLRGLVLATILLGLTIDLPAGPSPTPTPRLFEPTSTHDFADVEHWSRVFDAPSRDAWQRPRDLLAALDLQPGMWVADLGAGTGYFSRHLATAVGPEGVVFAVETEPTLVAHLRTRAETEKTPQVTPILASFDDSRLPPGALDLIVMVDTFHHIADRLTYLQRLKSRLKPSGRIAVVDWKPDALDVGPERSHRIAKAQVEEEMRRAGYTITATDDTLPNQYLVITEPGH